MSKPDVTALKKSGAITSGTLAAVAKAIKPGVTTKALDELAETYVRDHGGTPAFLGYAGFPATLCTSVNAQVVHGIPGEYELAEGDIVSIDVGVKVDGWFTDSAFTAGVGEISQEAQHLLEITEKALYEAISTAVPGNRTGDLGHTVETLAHAEQLGVVRDCVGHGIGRKLHMEPSLPNFGQAGTGTTFTAGMALAIEPMLVTGDPGLELAPDKWTLSTADRGLAAHFEETVLVTEGEPQRLTPLPGALRGKKRGGKVDKVA